MWADFCAVVDAAQADGELSRDAAAELRRLAYAFMAVLADIYAAGAGREAGRGAFLARARRALDAATAAAAEAMRSGVTQYAAVQAAAAAAVAAAMSPQQPQPPARQQAAAAVAAA